MRYFATGKSGNVTGRVIRMRLGGKCGATVMVIPLQVCHHCHTDKKNSTNNMSGILGNVLLFSSEAACALPLHKRGFGFCFWNIATGGINSHSFTTAHSAECAPSSR